ncbi:MAG: cyclodeaminase/cyclohydrolase family protein [Candidatus Poseidonia sp.]|nr:cyclodeaminase/cyclohydrolase family protein [Poseidonia sp.]MBL6805975.1 cyclodeaminase/cyclohydrolase family protein [Poseidonia sp.]MBL6892055.1 cyclodeaminase/cyclohydrolase family protein [Poseidonia sp.]
MNWMDMTLREYQAALASSSPTPGGGTAAAIALGQASALSIMVCDLTLGREKWKEGWSHAESTQLLAIPMLNRSGELAQADSDAFDDVVASFRLPKESDDEKNARKNAIRDTTLRAAEVPFETAQHAMNLLVKLPSLAKYGNANAVTDVGVASLLASAAAKGALFNVEINLQSLPENMGMELRQQLPAMKERIRTSAREVMDEVRLRMED